MMTPGDLICDATGRGLPATSTVVTAAALQRTSADVGLVGVQLQMIFQKPLSDGVGTARESIECRCSVGSIHGDEQLQIVGEMMTKYTERVDKFADRDHVGCEEQRSKDRALWHARVARRNGRRMLVEFNELLATGQIRMEPGTRRVADAELSFESVDEYVVGDGVKSSG